ncbi:MgtC family protein [archaeon BMS3Bbin15]|nr:MgtC family protein [archaeon BMS3Bbin15]
MVYESHILFIKLVIIAAFAGGLLGVEREMMHKAVAGTRTFMLTSILGVLSVYIASQTSQIFLSITLVGIFLIAILIGIIKNFMNDDIGITTVSAFIMAFMIGIIIGLGRPIEGVAMSIIATAILTTDILPRLNTVGFYATLISEGRVTALLMAPAKLSP